MNFELSMKNHLNPTSSSPLRAAVVAALAVSALSGAFAENDGRPDRAWERTAKIALNEVTAVADAKGWLKEEFDRIGATATLVPCTVTVVPQLMERGDVNIANSMHGFSFVQLLSGFDPVIIWQSADIDPRTVVITVRQDSPLHSLADLKGRSLGVSQWTCGYYGSFEALKAAGLPLETQLAPGEVSYINITDGGVLPVLLSGKVDAVATHPSVLAAAYNKGLVRDIGTAVPGGHFVHGDRIVYYSPREWALNNLDIIRAFVKVQEQALDYIKLHPDESAELVADAMRLPAAVVKTQFHEPGNHRLVRPEKNYEAAVQAFTSFQAMAISNNDGLITEKRRPLTTAQIARLIDRSIFRGGVSEAPAAPLEAHSASLDSTDGRPTALAAVAQK